MSNKKFRPQAQSKPQGQQPPPEDMQEMIDKLNSYVGDTLSQAGVQVEAVLTQCFTGEDDTEGLSDEFVRRMLRDCLTLAWQNVQLTSAVLGTIDVAQLRRIVAGEFKLPDMMRKALRASGIDPALFEGEPAPQPVAASAGEKTKTKAQKRPRGAKHPLVTLMQNALQNVKFIDRVTRATNPEVHNLKPPKAA